jgi:hypothetical protein
MVQYLVLFVSALSCCPVSNRASMKRANAAKLSFGRLRGTYLRKCRPHFRLFVGRITCFEILGDECQCGRSLAVEFIASMIEKRRADRAPGIPGPCRCTGSTPGRFSPLISAECCRLPLGKDRDLGFASSRFWTCCRVTVTVVCDPAGIPIHSPGDFHDIRDIKRNHPAYYHLVSTATRARRHTINLLEAAGIGGLPRDRHFPTQ